ncbi:ATP-binding protein [Aminipila luticellarii]|uniref:AAA family ATPase n=1 Tax=Aminipila luticellarii TaxID=2507160 RepID=A0A410PT14_9FIRM|nr:ATP-binding protein [Aminipila luticellarii]QAT42008.1 AAA family ATPase [Aminipila luticellarii]
MSIADLIGETTEYDKKQALEVKKPKSWCKSVSAFANGAGGILIFGISDDDEIVGLTDAEHDAEIISEQIKTRLNPIPNFKLRFYNTEDEKRLIILDIYAGEQTPYYYDADGSLTAFHRVGNQSIPVSPAKLKELVLRGSATSYDSLKSKYNFDNMAFTKLKSTYKQRTGIQFEDSDYESFGIVEEEGILTNAGALLADESPIRHSRLFCTRWNGTDKAPGIIDAIDDKEYSGGLINLLQNGMDFVTNNSKRAWKKITDGRMEMPDYPERAVLEGIVNALIHRNYLEVGSEVHIDMFDDRIEIYSPGGMYDGIKIQERDLMQIPSRRRNPVIADIFNRLKYMDRRGSGFKKILGDYKIQPQYTENMKPEFKSDNDSFLLILKNLNYSQKAAIKSGDKKAAIKSGDKKITNKTQQQYNLILNYMEKNKEYRMQDFCDLLQLKESRTKTILKGLTESEKIETIGAKRDRRYRLR